MSQTSTHLRVWRGWRLDTLTPAKFQAAMAETFIPATAQVMPEYGLRCYIPGVLEAAQVAGLPCPDEVALLFYVDRKSYDLHRETVAGRAYGLLHQAAFRFGAGGAGAPSSSSEVASVVGQSPTEPSRARWRQPVGDGPSLRAPQSAVLFAMIGLQTPSSDPTRWLAALPDADAETVLLLDRALLLLWLARPAKDTIDEARQLLARMLDAAGTPGTVLACHVARDLPAPARHFAAQPALDVRPGQTVRFCDLAPAGAASPQPG